MSLSTSAAAVTSAAADTKSVSSNPTVGSGGGSVSTNPTTTTTNGGGATLVKLGGKVQLCRLSAPALIALWGKKFAEEERRKEAKLERETDLLEAQLNQYMRDSVPLIEHGQTWNWVEQTSQRDAYVWTFPVPNNRVSDVVDRCVERINARNRSPDEESRWLARNSSDCDAHKKSITVCLAFGPI